jgi:hypothetical protein
MGETNAAQDKVKAPKKAQAELKRIEAHAALLRLSQGEYAGLKAHKGWANGKQVTEKEFESALKAFRGASIRGGK